MKKIIVLGMLVNLMLCCAQKIETPVQENGTLRTKNPYYSRSNTTKLDVSNEEWQRILPQDLYEVARLKATERAFTGKYNQFDAIGTYYCAVCGNALFRSDAKFSSTCGWPSFFESLGPKSVRYETDSSHGMIREEVLCGRCDSHLGHRFEDGPPPTGYRFCMNSVSLEFEVNSPTSGK